MVDGVAKMVKCPYCKKSFLSKNVKVELVGGGFYKNSAKLFLCPKCESVLGIGECE